MEFVLVLASVLFDVGVELVNRVLVVELTTVDVEVVFFAIMIIPDVLLLVAVELLLVEVVSWLVEVDSVGVGVLTRLDELVLVEPELVVVLAVGSVVGAPEVSLVELAAV